MSTTMAVFLSNELLQIGGAGYSCQGWRDDRGGIEGVFVGIHSDGGGDKKVMECMEDMAFGFVRVRNENM